MRTLAILAAIGASAACTTSLAQAPRDGSTPADGAVGADVEIPDGGTGADRMPCDPLAPPPTALGTVLGVGQDAAGTLYVADTAADGQNRVFVSNGRTLVRQRVTGSGQMGSGQYTFSFESRDSDGSGALALLLNVQGGRATDMALGPPGRDFLSDASVGVTRLTVVDPGTVSGFAVLNLPGVVAYVGDVSNGDVLVLTEPMDAYSSDAFRVFYGTPPREAEGTITSFSQALSGYPQVTFVIGATTYTMAIAVVYADGSPLGQPGPGTLSIAGGPAYPFSLREPTPVTLPGLAFDCLR